MNWLILIGVGILIVLEVKQNMTQDELLAKLQAQTAQVNKVVGEIEALKKLVQGSTDVPQPIVDAVNALGASIQTADDENSDTPAPTV